MYTQTVQPYAAVVPWTMNVGIDYRLKCMPMYVHTHTEKRHTICSAAIHQEMKFSMAWELVKERIQKDRSLCACGYR